MSLALAPLDVSVELEANLPCRKFDPDLWFSDAPAQLELAKSLCGDCPVRVECLAAALSSARLELPAEPVVAQDGLRTPGSMI